LCSEKALAAAILKGGDRVEVYSGEQAEAKVIPNDFYDILESPLGPLYLIFTAGVLSAYLFRSHIVHS